VERRKNREREGRQDTQPLRSVGEAGVQVKTFQANESRARLGSAVRSNASH
jgi:hypothetical protein